MYVESISYFIIILGIALVLIAVLIAFIFHIAPEVLKLLRLKRHSNNPVLSPPKYSDWEAVGTFNPAAVADNNGNIHIVYRAIGADGMSRFGYAVSKDGKKFDDKSPYPIFVMQSPRKPGEQDCLPKFDSIMYPSGGSWGGCEDPRMVRLDGKIYLTFNAFDGWDYIRVALTSIDEKDFFDKKWKWSRPLLISPPREIHKNWVLFPQKFNNKYAILHSISPEIQIDFVNNLEDLSYGNRVIKSRFGQKNPRKTWDSWLRGVGPPPIKTERGWLILYHAIQKEDGGRYKLGAMLLDSDNPAKVTHQGAGPILEPNEWYENDWKPGVIYACGAVVKDGRLFVYYGGGDKHVCVAETPLNELLDSLIPNTPA